MVDAKARRFRRCALRQARNGAAPLHRRHCRSNPWQAIRTNRISLTPSPTISRPRFRNSRIASSSGATPPPPTRRGRSTRERSGADSVFDTCSKGARAGLRGRSGSASSSSQPRPGRRFGRTGLRVRPRRSTKCRRTSSPASPICSARKSLRLKARRRCANSLWPRPQSTGMNGQIDALPRHSGSV